MGKKNNKKQTGGNLKLIFSILLSILIIFLLMNYIYSTYCDGFTNMVTNTLYDNKDNTDRVGICKALAKFLRK